MRANVDLFIHEGDDVSRMTHMVRPLSGDTFVVSLIQGVQSVNIFVLGDNLEALEALNTTFTEMTAGVRRRIVEKGGSLDA